MKRGRHVAPESERASLQSMGELCAQTRSACTVHDLGGSGRHLAIPRHPVRWPSSSQAGLASFGSAR